MKAAAFSYSATAMPRLTGALITVAGFMPIGFAKSTTGEYAGGIFWIVGIAVVFSWFVSGLITPYLAVKMLPKDFGKHHHGGDPYDTPFYRKLRGWIDFAHRAALVGDRRDRGRPRVGAAGMKLVPQQFFPNSDASRADRRAAPEGRRVVRRDDRAGQEDGGGAREGRGRASSSPPTRAPARRASTSRSIPELPNPGYAAVRRDDEGHGSARTGALAADGDASTSSSRRRGCASRASRWVRRWASRCSSASSARTRRRCARSRARSKQVVAVEPEGARRAARLERPGAHAEGRSRPGQGARARPRAGRRRARDADA